MKKIIGISILAALIFTSITAFATPERVDYDLSTKNFVVTGKVSTGLSGKRVKLTVIKPGYNISSLAGDEFSAALYNMEEVYTGDGGSYRFDITSKNAYISGDYSFYVQDDDSDEPILLTKYYANDEEKKNVIEKINSASEDTIKGVFLESVKALDINESLLSDLSETTASLLYQYKTKTSLDENDAVAAKNIIERLAVVAAFNAGKTDLLFKDGKFNYSDIFDFSEIDKNGVTLYDIYSKEMSDAGKAKVREGLYNNNLKNTDDLLNKFAELVFVNALSYPKDDGTGHIAKVLTSENADRVGINTKAYLNITNSSQKKNVELALASNGYSSAAQIEAALPGLVEKYKVTGTSSSGGSGGGSVPSNVMVNVNTGIENNIKETGFSDMDAAEWAKEAVNYLYSKGIVSGTGNNMFSPNNSVTREQFAVMLINALGVEMKDTENVFTDVKAGSYYEKQVLTAVELGIVNGVGDGMFGTGKTITRQDLCTLIYRAYFEGEGIGAEVTFSDKADISEYAQQAVNFLANVGIINGFDDNTFRPKAGCTRAQAAKLLYGAIKYKESN